MSLELLTHCNFDHFTRLDEVWAPWPDAEDLVHTEALQTLLNEVDKLGAEALPPPGRVLVGTSGAGKTHLLRHLRREIQKARSGFFFLIDGTDVRDFWSTLMLGMTQSLMREYQPGWTQAQALRYFLIRALFESDDAAAGAIWTDADSNAICRSIEEAQRLPGFPRLPGIPLQPVLRALFYLGSPSTALQERAMMWLLGVPLDQKEAESAGLPQKPDEPKILLRSITGLCAKFGPCVIAFDQLDALIAQHHANRAHGQAEDDTYLRSKEILHGLGSGLIAIHDQARRTLVTLSCLEEHWEILKQDIGNAARARFHSELIPLNFKPDRRRPLTVLRPRIELAAAETGQDPSGVLALFNGAFSDKLLEANPRMILNEAEIYRRECIRQGALKPYAGGEKPALSEEGTKAKSTRSHQAGAIEQLFKKEMASVDIRQALGEEGEDRLGKGLAMVLPLLRYELNLPAPVDLSVESTFTGGRSYPTLHARLRLIFREEGDREFHVCVRVLEKRNLNAFSARLNAAMIESGIDRALPFRQLLIFRNEKLPVTGQATQNLLRLFGERKGRWTALPEESVRLVKVLLKWKQNPPQNFEEWLKTARPLSKAQGLGEIVKIVTEAVGIAQGQDSVVEQDSATPSPKHSREENPVTPRPVVTQGIHDPPQGKAALTLGRRAASAGENDITIPIAELSRHVVIRAGSGGGKTVLIKRLVELAALGGVSSVVLDPGNDLAQMALDWDAAPGGWLPGDAALRDRLRAESDVVIYTPGRSDGRPLHLPFLPDFASIKDDSDDLQSAIESALDRLAALIAPGNSVTARHKRGCLAKAFRKIAEIGRATSLAGLAELFETMPEELDPGVPRAGKLMEELSGSIRALIAQQPGLDAPDNLLDWHQMFGLSSTRPRISIINFTGLPGVERQQDFVARLAESLFVWMRNHPSAGPAGLTGLLVLDEAKDFLPAQFSVPSKKPLMRLAAQARKYGVGLILATQNPKDLDYNAVAQFSTQYFGKANAPQVIEFIQKLLAERGAGAAQPALLKRGQFYLVSEATGGRPEKVTIPMCLTAHPEGKPLSPQQILALASKNISNL